MNCDFVAFMAESLLVGRNPAIVKTLKTCKKNLKAKNKLAKNLGFYQSWANRKGLRIVPGFQVSR